MFKKLLFPILLLFFMTLPLNGCGADNDGAKIASNAEFSQTASPQAGESVAVLQTALGTIKIRLFSKLTPNTVQNFTELIKQKKYDGVIFHRVVPGFVIQAGDFEKGDGTGGYSWQGPGTEVQDEIRPELKHIVGAVAMAKKGGASSFGSQFYITVGVSQFLDGQYTVFGQVIEGLDVAQKIAALARDSRDRPTNEKSARIEKMTLE